MLAITLLHIVIIVGLWRSSPAAMANNMNAADIKQKNDAWCVENMLDRILNPFVTFLGNAK